MNKKINLAVAGAVLLAASAANAGIIIPAGEWTLDVNGNVNHFMIMENSDNNATIAGGIATTTASKGTEDRTTQNTGLLPAWLGFTGTTRQNDLDVSFTISFQPGTSSTTALAGGGGTENRQAFITFGDKSWGTIKAGKDLGIYGSDAILSDMTLLGVGGTGLLGAIGNGTTTTLGHIGTGYQYADWKGQFSYTTPNMNGFQATVGIMQPWNTLNLGGNQATAAAITFANLAPGAAAANGASAGTAGGHENYGYEGKASYTFANGKVWAGFIQQDVDSLVTSAGTAAGAVLGTKDEDAYSAEIGTSVSFGNLGLTGYYYSGEGAGTTGFLMDGFDSAGNARDSDGAFVQATYVVPTGTKLGVSYGRSDLDATVLDRANAVAIVSRNEMWTVGAYHPLTKHLNLVAEYNSTTTESMAAATQDVDSDSVSLGAILFF